MSPGPRFNTYNVCDWLTFHNCISYFPLLRTIPNRRVSTSALMVTGYPLSQLTNFIQILNCTYTTGDIYVINNTPTLLLNCFIDNFNCFKCSSHVFFGYLLFGNIAQTFTIITTTNTRHPYLGPAISKKSIDLVFRDYLSDNLGNLFIPIVRKKTGTIDPWSFRMCTWRAICISRKPFRMFCKYVLVEIICFNSCHHANAFF